MSAVSVETVSRTLEAVLGQKGCSVVWRDPADGSDIRLTHATAASADGLLPVFVVAGETVWRETTGNGFGLDIMSARDSLLGFRLRAIGAGALTTVMLATMEAMAQVTTGNTVAASNFGEVWRGAIDRIGRAGADPKP